MARIQLQFVVEQLSIVLGVRGMPLAIIGALRGGVFLRLLKKILMLTQPCKVKVIMQGGNKESNKQVSKLRERLKEALRCI
jgi:hypothetical protein